MVQWLILFAAPTEESSGSQHSLRRLTTNCNFSFRRSNTLHTQTFAHVHTDTCAHTHTHMGINKNKNRIKCS